MKCPECGSELKQIYIDGFYCFKCNKKVKALIAQPPRCGKVVISESIRKIFEAGEGWND